MNDRLPLLLRLAWGTAHPRTADGVWLFVGACADVIRLNPCPALSEMAVEGNCRGSEEGCKCSQWKIGNDD